MTRVKHPWYGQDVIETRNGSLSSCKGVVIRGQRMTLEAYKTGQDIAAAGSAGYVQENDGRRTHVSVLMDAGVEVRTDPCGMYWYIDKLPEPDAYLMLR